MPLKEHEIEEVVREFGLHERDRGSEVVKVALITKRLQKLEDHIQEHPNDSTAKSAVQRLIRKRENVLNWLKEHAFEKYLDVVKRLGICD